MHVNGERGRLNATQAVDIIGRVKALDMKDWMLLVSCGHTVPVDILSHLVLICRWEALITQDHLHPIRTQDIQLLQTALGNELHVGVAGNQQEAIKPVEEVSLSLEWVRHLHHIVERMFVYRLLILIVDEQWHRQCRLRNHPDASIYDGVLDI